MRKTIITMLAFLAPFRAEAQEQEKADSVTLAEFSLNHQLFIEKGLVTNRVYGQAYSYFWWLPSCGYWTWLYGEYQYISGVAGVFCDPSGWLSLGTAYGMENFIGDDGMNQTYGRWAGTAWVGTERTNLEIYHENGSSRTPWTRADLWLYSGKRLSFGGIYQTGDGAGPRLQVTLPLRGQWDLRLWAAPVWNEGSRNTLVEARVVWTLKEPE